MTSDMGAPYDDERLTAMGLFVETYRALSAVLTRSLAGTGLSDNWFELLLRLARSPGGRLRMSDLAAQTGLSPSGLTRAIDRLEDAGLVTREVCPSDRRGAFAVLSPAGRERLEAALPGHLSELQESFVEVLTADEMAALTAALRKLRDALHPCAVAGGDGEPP
jgi:MarR family transcriptional regulator, 2-MHQ and catechol-resistance regulon repressor